MTDSTASLPPDLAERSGVHVVPLVVVVDGTPHHEGVDLTTEDLAALLGRRERLTTSQPSVQAFLDTYEAAASAGAERIVSVHLSGDLSGTVHAAALAARSSPVPVEVVDSRTVAMALGYAVLAAARAAEDGLPTADVVRAALRTASGSTALFVVDSLDHLRRGGRLSPAAAAVGSVLGLRPVLGVRDGRVDVVQKVRGRAAVLDRLVAAAVEALEEEGARVAMHHLGDDELVMACARRVRDATGQDVLVSPVSAVLGVHAGPGLVALVVSRDVAHRSGDG
ncbi:DegV family protein [Sanguibacter suaedae]|uniref:DegV family protein n=1 Tax=Sanguibacter suaedae TaxID=2795737 RepID=UPI0027DB5423|nr:DegV family protein [Sanguibacter suaedae]